MAFKQRSSPLDLMAGNSTPLNQHVDKDGIHLASNQNNFQNFRSNNTSFFGKVAETAGKVAKHIISPVYGVYNMISNNVPPKTGLAPSIQTVEPSVRAKDLMKATPTKKDLKK